MDLWLGMDVVHGLGFAGTGGVRKEVVGTSVRCLAERGGRGELGNVSLNQKEEKEC